MSGYEFDLCPMCHGKGSLVEDQFNRVLKCGNETCVVEIYREIRVKPFI
jgi:hypothetical protein